MAHEDDIYKRSKDLLMEINIFPRKSFRAHMLEDILRACANMLNLEIVIKEKGNENE